RAVERRRVAAGEIGAGRAAVRHEQRVAHESGVADHMRGAGRRVSGRVQDMPRHRADSVGVAVREQPVKLAAIALELGPLVEYLAEGVLYDRDLLADPQLAAQPL